MTPADIVAALHKFRFHYSNELELQHGIHQIFAGIPSLKREARLNATERPDFFIEDFGIVIEAKIKGSTGSVLDQLTRYAKIDAVKGLVLVTTRRQQALRMPYILEGKPLAVCYLPQL